ncbi:SGNH/GDSL hydrolase family protein [Meridianimarinicoccus sp. RP-17]|uniref:SGNH/GDSL hydrolase family protein n=1 Tax=Meridianimarinicoccus zhengii TaxID=2056810 RepID=UPI000DAC6046|nr:SGNH/GDSL hydrolase family protein [Phycocomes zhengii]
MSTCCRSTVLCYGDSNTHGQRAMRGPDDVSRFRSHVRWPGRVSAALNPKVRVLCEGLPGRTTVHDDPIDGAHKNGLRILPAILESHWPIDVVVLMLGTNDLKTRFAVTPADIGRSVERLLGVIAGSRGGRDGEPPAVLLVAPPPIVETGWLAGHFAGGAEISHHLGASYADVAARWGCDFLDAKGVAEVDPVDGVHLTEAGHAALGAAIAAKLRTMLG